MIRLVCRGAAVAALMLAAPSCATGSDGDIDGAVGFGVDAGQDGSKIIVPDAHDGSLSHDTGAHDTGMAPKMDATLPMVDGTGAPDTATPDVMVAADSPTTEPDAGVDAGVDAGSPVPTTCTEANHAVGCCANNTNYYCLTTTSTTLEKKACGSGKVCTWNASDNYYTCETGTMPKASPSSADPIDCK